MFFVILFAKRFSRENTYECREWIAILKVELYSIYWKLLPTKPLPNIAIKVLSNSDNSHKNVLTLYIILNHNKSSFYGKN